VTHVRWPGRPAVVHAPATSANLGPGFDSLGLALSLHDEVHAQVTGAGLRIEVAGVGERTARYGEDHLVVRAMRAAFEKLGEQPPGIWLRCVNEIPHGFGLGSSAAAIVAGVLAARALFGGDGPQRLPDHAVLELAAALEGHADNVAACLAGGLTIAWSGASPGPVRCLRLDPLPGLTPVVCLPAEPLATEAARKVLPAAVPHADAVQNAARSALLIAVLTGAGLSPARAAPDPGALLDATQDFLHQPYRASSMPGTADLVGTLREAGIPAVFSGAGPAALALTVPGVTPGPDAVAAVADESGPDWTVSVLDIDRAGAIVRGLRRSASGRSRHPAESVGPQRREIHVCGGEQPERFVIALVNDADEEMTRGEAAVVAGLGKSQRAGHRLLGLRRHSRSRGTPRPRAGWPVERAGAKGCLRRPPNLIEVNTQDSERVGVQRLGVRVGDRQLPKRRRADPGLPQGVRRRSRPAMGQPEQQMLGADAPGTEHAGLRQREVNRVP
jgi:homoserine kinase